MDRYNFRGKRLDNGEWCFGNICNGIANKKYIGKEFFVVPPDYTLISDNFFNI